MRLHRSKVYEFVLVVKLDALAFSLRQTPLVRGEHSFLSYSAHCHDTRPVVKVTATSYVWAGSATEDGEMPGSSSRRGKRCCGSLGRAVEFVDDFVEPLGDRVIEFVATRVRVLTDSAHALAVVHRDVDDAPICLPDRYGRYGYTGSR